MMRQGVLFCCLCSFTFVACMQHGAGSSMGESETSGSEHALAQNVAALRRNADLREFANVDEELKLVKVLQQSLKRDQSDLREMHPRVRTAVDSVLVAVHNKLAECNHQRTVSSNQFNEGRIKNFLSCKQILSGLFTSIDEDGSLDDDVPAIATQCSAQLSVEGSGLAYVEAIERFGQTLHNYPSGRGSTSYSWWYENHTVDKMVQDMIECFAQETPKIIGVNDSITYLAARLCRVNGHDIEHYGSGVSLSFRHKGVQTLADARKKILEWCAAQKIAAEALASLKDDQIVGTAQALLENSPMRLGIGQFIVNWAPTSVSSRVIGEHEAKGISEASKSKVVLSDVGRFLREMITSGLGITERELPAILCLIHRFEGQANMVAPHFARWVKESSPVIGAFAQDYKSPIREQYVSPRASRALSSMAHAWKTAGILRPQNLPMVTLPSPLINYKYHSASSTVRQASESFSRSVPFVTIALRSNPPAAVQVVEDSRVAAPLAPTALRPESAAAEQAAESSNGKD